MKTINPSNKRSVEILRLLVANGPLCSSTLQNLLKPRIERRKLNEALARLRLRGLVVARYDGVFKKDFVFHQVNPRQAVKEDVARILGTTPEEVRPRFRHQELLHGSTCALWAERLEEIFPDATVVRDLDIVRHPTAKERMVWRPRDDFELRPDLMLLFNKEDGQVMSIAVEIEKTKKTDARLIDKLENYAAQTRVDGLLYLCDGIDIEERLRSIYQTKMPERIPRIGSYAGRFLMLAQTNSDMQKNDYALASAGRERLSLREWVKFLGDRSAKASAAPQQRGPALSGRPGNEANLIS